MFAGKTLCNFIEKDKKLTLTKSMRSEVLWLTGALGGWKSRCTWYQFVAHIIVFVQCSITVRESAELGASPQPPAPAKLSFKQKYSTDFRKTKWPKRLSIWDYIYFWHRCLYLINYLQSILGNFIQKLREKVQKTILAIFFSKIYFDFVQ